GDGLAYYHSRAVGTRVHDLPVVCGGRHQRLVAVSGGNGGQLGIREDPPCGNVSVQRRRGHRAASMSTTASGPSTTASACSISCFGPSLDRTAIRIVASRNAS